MVAATEKVKSVVSNGSCKNNNVSEKLLEDTGTDHNFKTTIVWRNVVVFVILHATGIYGLKYIVVGKGLSVAWYMTVTFLSGLGATMGAHRLFAHKSYKATTPLRFILILLQTISGQNCLYIWVRDHRLHHKYSDTNADPHNINRGFFFAHVGWLLCRKHPDVIEKGKTIDMSDLEADPLIMFQKKYYVILYILFALCFPVVVPVYFWDESLTSCMFGSTTVYALLLNVTWSVNSTAHIFGSKPYDKSTPGVQSSVVSFFSLGEGWHNYHHMFPWDYRTSEFGAGYCFTTFFIELCAYFGLAYDLKSASYNMAVKRALKTGDGSHEVCVPIRHKESRIVGEIHDKAAINVM